MAILEKIILGVIRILCGSEPPLAQNLKPQEHEVQLPQEFPPIPHQQQPVSHPQQKPHHQDPQHPQQQQHILSPPYHKPGQNQNQFNQHNEQYMFLRAQANQEGDMMARCFEQSHEAYARGDGTNAKQFSNQGHEHQHKMESLNKQASDCIFNGMWSRCISVMLSNCIGTMLTLLENNRVWRNAA